MERSGDTILFNDLDRFRYAGVNDKKWLPIEAVPELFQNAADEEERVGRGIQEITTGNAHFRSGYERDAVLARLTMDSQRLGLFLRELSEKAGDIIIDLGLPTAL